LILLLAFFPLSGWADEEIPWQDRLFDATGLEAAGFIEGRGGLRFDHDTDEKDASLGEARFQLDLTRDFDWGIGRFKGDLLTDGVTEEVLIDLRELNLWTSPFSFMDLKFGRQILTWGTGDLVFINDMFPKDWQAFFIGRDDEYLKAPSDALKVSVFSDLADIDLVYTPLFNGSTFVSGERLSYYNPMAGRIVGRDMIMEDDAPNRYFSDAEVSGRLSRRIGGVELALYGYSGFWQEPEGIDPQSGKVIYPRLNVWGGSVRSALLGGVGNVELGYYDSIQSDNGTNPFIRPSEYRFLVGFERELAQELTGGLQYYLELIDEYEQYESNLPKGSTVRDEYRHMLTLRLTKLLMQQNLTLSLFVYYSPSDEDGYVRPKFSYKLTDQWLLDGGFNLFWGEREDTFWGRFQENNNIYLGLRYSF
jgi:hypothetical protein